jgi:hypothetical protein
MEDLLAFVAKPRLRLLLDHFAGIKIRPYPLREVLFLVVCGTTRAATITRSLSIGARLT